MTWSKTRAHPDTLVVRHTIIKSAYDKWIKIIQDIGRTPEDRRSKGVGGTKGAAMTDYWLSKLFFDLQQDQKLAAEYRTDMAAVIDRYEIKPQVRKALLADDLSVIAPLVNAYLLRFYFQIRGMPESEFMARLHALQQRKEAAHG